MQKRPIATAKYIGPDRRNGMRRAQPQRRGTLPALGSDKKRSTPGARSPSLVAKFHLQRLAFCLSKHANAILAITEVRSAPLFTVASRFYSTVHIASMWTDSRCSRRY